MVFFPTLHTTNKAQEMYTPAQDAKKILSFIPKKWIIYECCYGEGDMAKAFEEEGYAVVGSQSTDFFTHEKTLFSDTVTHYDVIITNPPWRNHKDFVEKALHTQKPFAFLLRLEHLGGVRAYELFHDNHIQVIIPKNRINYITPKVREGKSVAGSPFHSCWITKGLNLDKDIFYME